MTEGIQRNSYSEVVVEGDSIVRKTNRVLNKGHDVVVCLLGAKIETITERLENIMGSGKGGSVLVHLGTNNVEREGTAAIVRKYIQLIRTLKQTWVEVGYLEVHQALQEAQTHKPVTKCQENIFEAGYKCVCLNARSIVNKKKELNIMVEDIDPHIIVITKSWANIDITDA